MCGAMSPLSLKHIRFEARRTYPGTRACPRCGGLVVAYALEGEEGRVPENVYCCVLCNRLYIKVQDREGEVWKLWTRRAIG